MKKHLIAAAVAAAVAVPAMAQNVTLYGTLDGSVQSIQKATAAGSATAYFDGAVASSVWGMRGSEDLGGGLKATFETQGDLMTNNGGTHTAGLFRRAANVGLGGAFGQVDLGLKLNPLIAANAALMPVSGNSVSTMTATVMGFADFFTKNAVTYTSPSISGFQAQAQYGMSNNAGNTSDGSVAAWRLSYSAGGLTANIAGQNRKAVAQSTGSLSSANNSTPATIASYNGATGLTSAANAKDSLGKNTVLFGVGYKFGAFDVAAAHISNKVSNGDADNTSTGTGGLAVGLGDTKVSANQIGLGYQMSPALQLGASLTTAASSRLTNIQARYALSKRTTGYAQYALASNDANGTVKFFPVAANTGTAPAAVISAVGLADTKQSSFGVGLIHSF